MNSAREPGAESSCEQDRFLLAGRQGSPESPGQTGQQGERPQQARAGGHEVGTVPGAGPAPLTSGLCTLTDAGNTGWTGRERVPQPARPRRIAV